MKSSLLAPRNVTLLPPRGPHSLSVTSHWTGVFLTASQKSKQSLRARSPSLTCSSQTASLTQSKAGPIHMHYHTHLRGQLVSRREGDLLSALLTRRDGLEISRGGFSMYIKDVGTCNKGFGFASESVPADNASAMPYHPMEAVKQPLWDRMSVLLRKCGLPRYFGRPKEEKQAMIFLSLSILILAGRALEKDFGGCPQPLLFLVPLQKRTARKQEDFTRFLGLNILYFFCIFFSNNFLIRFFNYYF